MANIQGLKFSIIIPVKEINDYLRETIDHLQRIASDDWELIIVPNDPSANEWSDGRIKFVASGRVGPAAKRDLAAEFALGLILVFLDDDSYPDENFLSNAHKYFSDEIVTAIGGPGITPPHDSFWQKVSGAVFLSKYSGGAPERYISRGASHYVDDWPSVNLMVLKKDFVKVGGFKSPYWPGEDTKLCLDLITTDEKKKIVYAPDVIVWHHRRAGIYQHLKQIGAYGLHRGYFVKRYPNNSRKITYFIPSAFLVFLLFSVIVVVFQWSIFLVLVLVGWLCYFLAMVRALIDIRQYHGYLVAVASLPYIFLTHVWYGAKFIQGILTRNLKSKLR